MPAEKISHTSSRNTIMGALALTVWAATAWVCCSFQGLSMQVFITTVLGGAFVGSTLLVTIRRKWNKIFQSPGRLFWGAALAAVSNQAIYVTAFRYAPPEHVDLLYYLWPLMVAFGRGLLPGEQLDRRNIIGILIGLVGIAVLMLAQSSSFHFAWHFLIGYGLALVAGAAWAGYSLLSRMHRTAPPELIGIACGPGALLGLVSIFFGGGVSISGNVSQLLLLAVWGFVCFGVSCFMWDLGVRRGNFKVLSSLCYAVPIGSVGLLVFAGLVSVSWVLILSCILVTIGSVIGASSKPAPQEGEPETELAAA